MVSLSVITIVQTFELSSCIQEVVKAQKKGLQSSYDYTILYMEVSFALHSIQSHDDIKYFDVPEELTNGLNKFNQTLNDLDTSYSIIEEKCFI